MLVFLARKIEGNLVFFTLSAYLDGRFYIEKLVIQVSGLSAFHLIEKLFKFSNLLLLDVTVQQQASMMLELCIFLFFLRVEDRNCFEL